MQISVYYIQAIYIYIYIYIYIERERERERENIYLKNTHGHIMSVCYYFVFTIL